MNTRPSNPNPNPNDPNATSSNSFHRPTPPTTTQASYPNHEAFFNGTPPPPQFGNMPPQISSTPGGYAGEGGSPIVPGAGAGAGAGVGVGGYGTPTGSSHLLGSPSQSMTTPRLGSRPLLPTSSNSTGGPPAPTSNPSIVATSPFSTIPTTAPTSIPTTSIPTPTPTPNPTFNSTPVQPTPRTRGPGKNSRASAAAAAAAASAASHPPPTNTSTSTTTTGTTAAVHHQHPLEEDYTAFADILDTVTHRQLAIHRFAKNHEFLQEVFGPQFERDVVGWRKREEGERERERRLGYQLQMQAQAQVQVQQQHRERERKGTSASSSSYDGQMMNLVAPSSTGGTSWITRFTHPGQSSAGLSLAERRSALEGLRDTSRHEMKEMERHYEMLRKEIQFTPT